MAAEAVRALRADGHRLRFVTNNTTRARAQLADDLRGLGVELEDGGADDDAGRRRAGCSRASASWR